MALIRCEGLISFLCETAVVFAGPRLKHDVSLNGIESEFKQAAG